MNPSQVRSRILSDHQQLRRDLDRLEALVAQVRDGYAPDATLRADTEMLITRVRVHMQWEESHLLPALREADAWGGQRGDQLVRDHNAQRELLDFLNTHLRGDGRPAALLARYVGHLIALLRDDMREEEAELLDERVLRDDVVAIDMTTG